MTAAARNIALYPWFKFAQNALFWQATWFLYFQNQLSGAEAILLYAIYDLATTVLEVPSGYLSDRFGRRPTLIASAFAGVIGTAFLAFGDSFAAFAMGQVLLGASIAFASGTDSALLFESLAAEDRLDEVEAQELRAWRATFAALAVTAVLGGALALVSDRLPFVASLVAFGLAAGIALALSDPPRRNNLRTKPVPGSILTALGQPVLAWLFVLSVLMYGYSHIPFVFGQPFISEALAGIGWQSEAPLISGGVTSVMMILSVLTSLVALRLRHALGLPGILLLAFAIQIALAGVLSASGAAIVILALFFRMVPSSLSGPFILARIQPLLSDEMRATYLSVQSLVGRILFAASLWLASVEASETANLSFQEIRGILVWYLAVGLIALAGLWLWARRVRIEPEA